MELALVNPQRELEAMHELRTLSQSRDLSDYVCDFKRVVCGIGMSKMSKKVIFCLGLKPDLADHLVNYSPETLAEFVRWTI
jgi:hypothetical protein